VNQKMLLKGFKRPKNISYDKSEQNPNYGKFTIFPFERGFGYTIGNSFRRVLLSSLPGYAISAIRIQTHDADNKVQILSSEFEPIPEVIEETLEVIKNLKNVKIKLSDDIESKTIRIERKGECAITAADLKIDETVQVVNSDHHIMTLSEKGHIEIELQIDLGRGYVDAERQQEYLEIIDAIPIDAIYSPIEKASYEVTNTRVGQRSDYDKLIFEMWTDGTIKPEDAMGSAAKILKEYFQVFINFEEEDEEPEPDVDTEEQELKQLLETPVEELELSVRASNCLRTANIRTIAELVIKTEDEISKIRHFGKKSLIEIKEKLQKQKLSFGMEDTIQRIFNKTK
jgi:DNA-directed RNA polymerase subunit alpha